MSPNLAHCARPDCGHSVTAHFVDRGCIVKGCDCKEFLAPGTLVTESARCTATNGTDGKFSSIRCSYPLGHGRIEIPYAGEADHGNRVTRIWWDSEEPESSYADADTPPLFSWSPKLAVVTPQTDEQMADRLAEPPAPLIRPYVPTIPTDLNGYLVIHAGDIKAGDTVQVIQVESGALQLQPIPATVIPTRSPLLQRIYDAIDQGWEYDFDTDCATGAVQDLLVELLQELDAYYGTLIVPVAELASMVKEGRWIK